MSDAAIRATVAIIGGGPAGITLALGLADRGIDVTILEAGGTIVDERSQRRYEGDLATDAGLDYPPLDVWRLRVLGGTSNHWGGWCRRLESNVFGERPWLGPSAWPFDTDDLERYYQRSHETCVLGRDEYDAATIQRDTGLDAWDGLGEHGLAASLWRYSTPIAFGDHYRARLERSVDVLTGANVTGFSATRGAVRSAVVVDDAGSEVTVDADVFVIACGGLESVRMLLASAPELNLEDHDVLGRGFMEHPHGEVAPVVIASSIALDPKGPLAIFRERIHDVDGTEVRAGLTVTPELCEELRIPNVSFTVAPHTDRSVVDGLPHDRGVEQLVRLLDQGREPAFHALYVRSEQRPIDESRIRLIDARDDLGMRRIRLDWRVHSDDTAAIAAAVDLAASALATLGVAVVHQPERLPIVTGGGHHLGGARMHEAASHGVVDPDLRVHGMGNLYVCSAATFPTGGYSNPTMTIVALAHRLGDHLAGPP